MFSKKGKVYEGEVVRAEYPNRGWGYYPVVKGKIRFRHPLRWVNAVPHDPDDPTGHWEYL